MNIKTRCEALVSRLMSTLQTKLHTVFERVRSYAPDFPHWDVAVIVLVFAAAFVVLPLLLGWKTDLEMLGILGSYALTFLVPYVIVARHRYRQDRLLDRIRAAFAMGIEALHGGQTGKARRLLRGIRRRELSWRLGASSLYRWALGATALAAAVAFGFLYHLFSVLADPYFGRRHNLHTLHDALLWVSSDPIKLILAIAVALFFGMAAMQGLSDIQGRPWVDFYGDRLAAAIKAGRGIEFAPQHEGALPPEGASARELLGLGQSFTKAELRRAWVRLARELHPDLWAAQGHGVQRIKEAALKRVNAARDELERFAH